MYGGLEGSRGPWIAVLKVQRTFRELSAPTPDFGAERCADCVPLRPIILCGHCFISVCAVERSGPREWFAPPPPRPYSQSVVCRLQHTHCKALSPWAPNVVLTRMRRSQAWSCHGSNNLLWRVTACSLAESYQRFGGTCSYRFRSSALRGADIRRQDCVQSRGRRWLSEDRANTVEGQRTTGTNW
jgi:hypothetical protein